MRLTEKKGREYVLNRNLLVIGEGAIQIVQEVTNKIGITEDFEEKIGITLSVLEQALEHGIVDKIGFHYHVTLNLCEKRFEYHWDFMDMSGRDCGCKHFYFKDYKKTWFLRMEELL